MDTLAYYRTQIEDLRTVQLATKLIQNELCACSAEASELRLGALEKLSELRSALKRDCKKAEAGLSEAPDRPVRIRYDRCD